MNWRFGEIGWRILPGAIASILTAGLLNSGLIQPLEQVAYSKLFQLRGERSWDSRLVLVTIDDDSIKQLGRFPWTRSRYVELIDRLTQSGASVIAIDLLFSESSPDDAALAKSMARSNRVVLAQADNEQGAPLLPVPEFQTASVGSGHIRIQADSDGMTRSIEPQVDNVLAFGIATGMTYSFLREAIALPDLSQRFWLNWAGRADRIPQHSFASVIRGEVPDSAFQHKIVIVGVTASATDAAPTPFDRNPPANGVHLQATLIDNLLQQNDLKPIAGVGMTILMFAIGGIGFSVLLSYWRTERQIAIASVAILAWVGASVVLLKANYLPPVMLPIGLILSSTIATVITERSRMNLILQRQVNQLQQRYETELITRPIENENQMLSVVSTLLDLQRLESGQQSFKIDRLDLHTWLPELLEPFDRQAKSCQQSFMLVIDPMLPVINSDRAALERILVELINNACKYTPPNEQIIVSVDRIASQIEIAVKNSGVEISEEARSRLFERFYRVPNADPWKQGGSGLGLALVEKLVESLQGTIEVTSETNWTIFTVKFPLNSVRPITG